MKTDFARALWEDPRQPQAAHRQRRRCAASASRDEIGGIAAFLASHAAAFMTGQVIVADGGVTIGS